MILSLRIREGRGMRLARHSPRRRRFEKVEATVKVENLELVVRIDDPDELAIVGVKEPLVIDPL